MSGGDEEVPQNRRLGEAERNPTISRAAPDRSRAAPISRATPDGSRTAPDRSRTAPDGSRTAPDRSRTAPDGSRAAPDGSRAAPDRSRTAPDGSRAAPDGSRATPDRSRATPDGSRTAPDGSRATPDGSRATPDRSRATPDGDVGFRLRLTQSMRDCSWPPSGSTCDGPVNDWSTISAPQSAAHAMMGIRAPAPKQPRRSDSHHSPRHDPSVPGHGKREVTVATVISNAEGHEAPRVTSVTATLADAHGKQGGHEDEKGGISRRRALRLGLRQVKGLKQEEMARLVARRAGGHAELADLRRRAGVSAAALDRLARADAFASLTLDRRGAIWRAIGLDRTGHEQDLPPLFAWAKGRTAPPEPAVALPPMTLGQEVAEDYANLRLTLRCHPLALLRPRLARRVIAAARLAEIDDGRWVEVAGLVLVRQRPGTASGVIFVTIEDETGVANLVVWPAVFERFRRVVLGAQLMVVRGKVQKEGLVIHVVAATLIDRTDLLRRLADTDRDFEAPVARADRVKRPSDSGQRPPRRRSAANPPFEAPVARADQARNSGPPDPRDPGHLSRRQRLLARLGKLEAPPEAPSARAEEVKPQARHPRLSGFKSRDFH
ncbi:MAG: OB-fold nucleic acid binding domain-containing protein [Geminicoccaceae bacterium]